MKFEEVIAGLEYIEDVAYGYHLNGKTLGKPTEEIENVCATAIHKLKTFQPRRLNVKELAQMEGKPVYLKLSAFRRPRGFDGYVLISGNINGRIVITLPGSVTGNANNMLFLAEKDYGVSWECWTLCPEK